MIDLPDLEFFRVASEFCPPLCPFYEAQFPYAEDQLVVNPNHAMKQSYFVSL